VAGQLVEGAAVERPHTSLDMVWTVLAPGGACSTRRCCCRSHSRPWGRGGSAGGRRSLLGTAASPPAGVGGAPHPRVLRSGRRSPWVSASRVGDAADTRGHPDRSTSVLTPGSDLKRFRMPRGVGPARASRAVRVRRGMSPTRHRLNRGGDRALDRAVHTIAMTIADRQDRRQRRCQQVVRHRTQTLHVPIAVDVAAGGQPPADVLAVHDPPGAIPMMAG
jgi:hypothetical protein